MRNGEPKDIRHGENCLTEDELCLFIARPSDADGARIGEIETHLARCPQCREELADLIKLLHPETEDTGEAELPLMSEEIQASVDLIRQVGEKEALRSRFRRRTRWVLAAAAAIVLLAGGAAVVRLVQQSRPNPHFLRARANLQSFYDGRSPSGLRLDLPFQSNVSERSPAAGDARQDAEVAFSQALVNHEDVPEIRLGLAAALLARSAFDKAREQFDEVLKLQKNHFQALLGRAVTYYESAMQAEDLMERRRFLDNGLRDIDAARQLRPDSVEARYNRVYLLMEAGRTREALEEIDRYLGIDPDSIWAARLKDLKVRMSTFEPKALQLEVERAARARDRDVLERLAAVVPAQAFQGMHWALKTGLQRDHETPADGEADAGELRWAAGILADARERRGDPSCNSLLQFYDGLSPPMRQRKKKLDAGLDDLQSKQSSYPLGRILAETDAMARECTSLKDVWQLVNVHHLRGNAYFYQADFPRAESEYLLMQRFAEQTAAPELQVRSLACLNSVYGNQSTRLADEQAAIRAIRQLSSLHKLEYWEAYASQASAFMHLRLNQLPDALKDFTAVLGFAYRTRDEALLEVLFENLIPIMDKLGRAQDADRFCGEAMQAMSAFERDAAPYQANRVLNSRPNLICGIANYSLEAGNLDRATSLFRAALALTPPESMKELRCRIKLGLAQSLLEKKQFPEAGSLLEECARTATREGYAELAWRAFDLQGRRTREVRDLTASADSFRRSVAVIESMRGRIASPELRQMFLAGRFDPYRDLVSLYYHELNDANQARSTAARAKSMALMESLNGSAGVDYPPAEMERDPRILAIDFFFLSDSLLAMVSGNGVDRIVELRLSRLEAGRRVQSLLASIRSGNEVDFTVLSRQLFHDLIGPLLPPGGNRGQDRLLLFPDGPLHLLPFGGLMDSAGQFLLQQYAISYAPSRNVLRYCLSLNRGSVTAGNRSVLLIDGSANLKSAQQEIANLLNLYGSRARILSAQNTAGAGDLAGNAAVIHFAGHASAINGKPVLLLNSGSNQRYLDTGIIETWRLRSNRLVILAACSTGTGPQADGDIPWGLVPAFLNAGAPALIVSLLPVDDPATASLSASLHSLLLQGAISKSEALRKAQLALLEKARAAGRLAPSSWVPYVLIGDPR